MVQVAEFSKKTPVDDDILVEVIPSLFSAVSLFGLVKTFIQLQLVLISQLSFQEAQFTNLLVRELVTADFDNCDKVSGHPLSVSPSIFGLNLLFFKI